MKKSEEIFRNMVASLEKPPSEILEGLDYRMVSKIHAGIGICGEAAEIMEGFHYKDGEDMIDNLIEELGDYEFYLRIVYSRYNLARINISESSIPNMTMGEAINSLVINSGKVLDLIKKECIYQNDLDEEKKSSLIGALYTIEINLLALRGNLVLTRDFILDTVVEKLSKRYPNFNYTNERAEKRMDKE